MAVGDDVVGMISIRVVPELKEFRAKMAAEFEKWDKLTVHVKAVTENFGETAAKIKELSKDQVAKVKADATNVQETKSRIDAVAKDRVARIRLITSESNSGGGFLNRLNTNLRQSRTDLQPDVVNTRSEMGAIRAETDRLMRGLESAKRMADASSIHADRLIAKYVAGEGQQRPIKLKPDVDVGAFARAKYTIEAMFHNVKVKIKPDKLNAATLLPDLAGGAASAAGGIAKVGAGAASSIPSLFSFAGVLMIVVAAIAVLLPPLLALSAGLITVAPAMLALIAPAAAVALGLDGIKKAATDAGLFADTNGSKKGGGAAGAALDELKQKVSDTFENGLKPAFASIAGLVQDSGFQGAMSNVASGLSSMFTGFTDALARAKPQINNIMSNVGKAFADAKPGIDSFTSGILNLVSALSNKFPSISEAINRTGKSFTEWVDKITTKDPVTQVSQLDTAMKALGDTMSGLGGILSTLFANGWDNLSNPSFGASMKGFVSDIDSLVSNTLPALATAFQTIATALKPIAAIVEAGSKIADLIPHDKETGMVRPMFGPFSKGSGEGDPAAAAAGEAAGAKFAGGLNNGLKGALSGGGMPGATGGFLATLIPPTAGEEAGQKLGQKLSQGMASVMSGTGAGGGVTNSLQGVLTSQIQAAAVPIQENLNAIIQPLLTLPATISGAFQSMNATINGMWSTTIVSLATGAQTAVMAVSNAFKMLPNAITGPMALMAAAAAQGSNAITTAFSTMGVESARVLMTSFAQLPGFIQGIMAEFVGAVVAGAADAVAKVSGIPGQMAGAISAGAGVLVGPGVALMAGLKSGLVQGMADVLAYASTIAGQIKAVKGPLPKDKKELIPAGLALMDGLQVGMDEGLQSVLDKAGEMAARIAEAIQSGVDPTQFKDSIKQMTDALEIQRSQLKVQQNGIPKSKENKDARAGLQTQMDQISAMKEQLNLTKKKADYDDKYGADSKQDPWEGMPEKISSGIQDVGQGVASAYAQDLGISGNGALQALVGYGTGFANQMVNKTVFNVSSADDAIAISKQQTSKQSLTYK